MHKYIGTSARTRWQLQQNTTERGARRAAVTKTTAAAEVAFAAPSASAHKCNNKSAQ